MENEGVKLSSPWTRDVRPAAIRDYRLSDFTFMDWKSKRQPTPVFLPGESQGWLSLVGCHLWGHTELDMTEVTRQQQNPHSSWLFLFSPPGRQVFTLWPQHGCHTSPDLTSSSSRSADHTYGGLCLSLRSLNNTM